MALDVIQVEEALSVVPGGTRGEEVVLMLPDVIWVDLEGGSKVPDVIRVDWEEGS